jgi:hypothetical protein
MRHNWSPIFRPFIVIFLAVFWICWSNNFFLRHWLGLNLVSLWWNTLCYGDSDRTAIHVKHFLFLGLVYILKAKLIFAKFNNRKSLERVIYWVRFQVLMAAVIIVTVFWDVVPCSLAEVYWHFRGAYCLHHQGDSLDYQTMQHNTSEDIFMSFIHLYVHHPFTFCTQSHSPACKHHSYTRVAIYGYRS